MPTKKRALSREWTRRDVQIMRKLARQRFSSRLAARALKRTQGAVKFKAMMLGVRFHAVEQPIGVQKRRTRVARRR
jgi:hypothetical protein